MVLDVLTLWAQDLNDEIQHPGGILQQTSSKTVLPQYRTSLSAITPKDQHFWCWSFLLWAKDMKTKCESREDCHSLPMLQFCNTSLAYDINIVYWKPPARAILCRRFTLWGQWQRNHLRCLFLIDRYEGRGEEPKEACVYTECKNVYLWMKIRFDVSGGFRKIRRRKYCICVTDIRILRKISFIQMHAIETHNLDRCLSAMEYAFGK